MFVDKSATFLRSFGDGHFSGRSSFCGEYSCSTNEGLVLSLLGLASPSGCSAGERAGLSGVIGSSGVRAGNDPSAFGSAGIFERGPSFKSSAGAGVSFFLSPNGSLNAGEEGFWFCVIRSGRGAANGAAY